MFEGLGLAGKLGITILLLVGAGLGAGYAADAAFHSSPLFILIGAIVGMVWAIWAIWKMTTEFREPLKQKKRGKPTSTS